MSLAACLMLSTLVLAVLGAPVLTRLTRRGTVPLLGVTAWLVAIGSVLATWLAAIALLVEQVLHTWQQTGPTVIACCGVSYSVTGGASGTAVRLILLLSGGLGAVALVRLAWRLATRLGAARRHNHRHGHTARLVGRPNPRWGAVVLDAPQRVAYCVAGRPGTIVVSTATLAALDDTQLAAVLDHERAHLTGHHHLIMAATRVLAALLPGVPLFAAGAIEVCRLLEMRADDRAARVHSPGQVARALAAMSGHTALPDGALGATGASVAARIERLLLPVGIGHRASIRGAVVLTLSTFLLMPATVGLVSLLAPGACGGPTG